MDHKIQIDSVCVSESSLRSSKWVELHYTDLATTYKNNCVLILNQTVIGAWEDEAAACRFWDAHENRNDIILRYF